jgi:hypothetical protein
VTKFALLIPTMFALMAGFNAKEATAEGFHFRSGGVHIDVGHVHHGHGHHGHYGHYGRRSYGDYGYGRHGYRRHGYSGWGGHSHWHDTTHLDYHPGYVVPHYDHYDYVPGHYDVHYDGHWDYHF